MDAKDAAILALVGAGAYLAYRAYVGTGAALQQVATVINQEAAAIGEGAKLVVQDPVKFVNWLGAGMPRDPVITNTTGMSPSQLMAYANAHPDEFPGTYD